MISDDACYVKCGEQHPLMLVGRRYEQLIATEIGADVIAARQRYEQLMRQQRHTPQERLELVACVEKVHKALRRFGNVPQNPDTREALIDAMARALVRLSVFGDSSGRLQEQINQWARELTE